MNIKRKNAFSLQELLVVVGIVALLVIILVTSGQNLRSQAEIKTAKNTLEILSTAVEKYHSVNGDYPLETDYMDDVRDNNYIDAVHDNNEELYKDLNNLPYCAEILEAVPEKFLTAKDGSGNVMLHGDGVPRIRIVDPWGNPYRYVYEEGYGVAVIDSAGPDGEFAEDEDNISY